MNRLPRGPKGRSQAVRARGKILDKEGLRRLQAFTNLARYLDFPHASHLFQIERIRKPAGKAESHEIAYGITSLTPAKASPSSILQLVRGHWSIENRLHWVRDVTFDEGRSRVRKGAAEQALAALRSHWLKPPLVLAGPPDFGGTLVVETAWFKSGRKAPGFEPCRLLDSGGRPPRYGPPPENVASPTEPLESLDASGGLA